MHEYITNITLAKGSGEYCICQSHRFVLLGVILRVSPAHILAPGAHARMPLVDRIAALRIPISFICTCFSLRTLLSRLLRFHVDGEYDWMDPVGGITSIDNLKAAGNQSARMYIVPHAGHHG